MFYLLNETNSLLQHKISHILSKGNVCTNVLANLGTILPDFTLFSNQNLSKQLRGMVNLDKTRLPYIRFK